MREQLTNLLPDEFGVPEYETQDMYVAEEEADAEDSSGTTTEEEDNMLSFIDLYVGKCVDVYWAGEKQWFHGKVTALNNKDTMFEVFYPSDSEQLWHYACDYAVREPEA